MNVLISGGTGQIGKALVEALLEDGHQLTVLTRNPEKARGQFPAQVQPILWDGRDTGDWAQQVETSDAVINLAGASIAGENLAAILTKRWTPAYKGLIRTSRVAASQALVNAIQAASHKPKVFIQASAVGYYGPRTEADIPESTPAGTDFLAQVCRDWEKATAPLEDLGIRRVIVRTGLVLSTQGGILPIMLLPTRLFVGGPLGSGKQAVPWIHLADEVSAIRFLLENPEARGAYNLTAPNPVPQREMAEIAGQVLKRPSWFPTPALALKLALGEKASLVLEGQNARPHHLLAAGFQFRFENLDAALEDLLISS